MIELLRILLLLQMLPQSTQFQRKTMTNSITLFKVASSMSKHPITHSALQSAAIRIGGDQYIEPGDYVYHEKHGVGKYLGLRIVNAPRISTKPVSVVLAVVKYSDAEISWDQKVIEKALTLYSSKQSEEAQGVVELSSFLDPRINNTLILNENTDCITISGNRIAKPGDNVVHEKYGIGEYLGLRVVNIAPRASNPTHVVRGVVKYSDVEISWDLKFAEQELMHHEGGRLSSFLDQKKWNKLKSKRAEEAVGEAMDILKVIALRTGFHRTPCLPPDESYRQFEQQFAFTPTDDQLSCFQVSLTKPFNFTRSSMSCHFMHMDSCELKNMQAVEFDMVEKTVPMDR